MVDTDNNPERPQSPAIFSDENLAGLEVALAKLPQIDQFTDYMSEMTNRRDALDDTVLNRRDRRHVQEIYEQLVDGDLEMLSFDLLTIAGSQERFQELLLEAAEQYPEVSREYIRVVLGDTFAIGSYLAGPDESAPKDKNDSESEQVPELTEAELIDFKSFLTDSSEDPAFTAEAISLLAQLDRHNARRYPRVKSYVQAMVLSGLLKNELVSENGRVAIGSMETRQELKQRILTQGLQDHEPAVLKVLDFLEKIGFKEPAEVAIGRIALLAHTEVPAELALHVSSKLSEMLTQALRNYQAVAAEMKFVSALAERRHDPATEKERAEEYLRAVLEFHVKQTNAIIRSQGHSIHDPRIPTGYRTLESHLRRAPKRKATAAVAVSSTIEVTTVDTTEELLDVPRTLTAAHIEGSTVTVNGRTPEDVITSFSRKNRGRNVAEMLTGLVDALCRTDFSSSKVPGIKPIEAAKGSFKDTDGKNVAVFELKASEFPGFETSGPLLRSVRIVFTLNHDGSLSLLKIVKKQDFKTAMNKMGISVATAS